MIVFQSRLYAIMFHHILEINKQLQLQKINLIDTFMARSTYLKTDFQVVFEIN